MALIPFDASKYKEGDKVITAGGKQVRILCIDGGGTYPVIGLITDNLNILRWRTTGKFNDNPPSLDLYIEEPEMWVNIYPHDTNERRCGSYIYDSKYKALVGADKGSKQYKLVEE